MKLIDRDFLLNWLGAIRVKQIEPAYEEAYRFVSSVVKDKRFIIKAIPIWWIDSYCTDCSIGLRKNDAEAIKKLLEDWREE